MRRLWALSVCAGFAVVFILPRFVPTAPSISDSYLFGFNNHICVLLLLLLLGVAGISAPRMRWDFPSAGSRGDISASLTGLWLVVFLVAGAGTWYLVRGVGGFGESIYLIDRIRALADSQIPYRDFEFAYGPIFLYLPLFFMRLHCGVVTAYYSTWLLATLTGVWLLARCLTLLEIPGARKSAVFSLFCLFALPGILCTGTNYCLVRFLAPIFAALRLENIQRLPGTMFKFRVIASAALYTFVLLLISPEVAISFAFGSLCWFAVLIIRHEMPRFVGWATAGALALVQALLFFLADHFHAFDTMSEFGRGAYAFLWFRRFISSSSSLAAL